MPRPKRSKVAPSAPTKIDHLRVPQPAVIASAAQKQKDIFSPASSGRTTNGSDDSDGLVVAKRIGRTQRNDTTQEYRMSGALALEDIGTTRLKLPSGKTRAELTRITREADHAQAVKEGRARSARIPAAEVEDPEQIPSSIPTEPLSAQKRMGSSSSKRSSTTLSNQGTRIHETPRIQPSMLGGVGFKKRPRQPSLLQMIQSQNQTQAEVEDDDMYNFLPDDESTPIIKSLSQSHVQRKSSSSVPTSGSRKRKQATPEIQVPASQSQSTHPNSSPSSSPPQSVEQEDLYDISTENQPQPSLPRHHRSQTPQTQIHSDTLAPPQSSSPVKSVAKPDRSKPTKGASKSKPRTQQPKRKEPAPAPSPVSSTSTLISPIRTVKIKPLTTATLQNLLPRRRARGKPKGEYDMPSSSDVELDNTGLGEDEDELSFHATKVRRKTSGKNGPKNAAKRKEMPTKKTPKTYTRKSLVVSDDDDDESASATDGDDINENTVTGKKKVPGLDDKAKAEMKRLADKFREVDEYTLDFEDMTGSSSQMKDAR